MLPAAQSIAHDTISLHVFSVSQIYQDPPSQNSSSSDISKHQNRLTVVAALLITSIMTLHIVSISNILYHMNPKKVSTLVYCFRVVFLLLRELRCVDD